MQRGIGDKPLRANKETIGEIRVEKSIYDPASTSDGVRILVMRMWPRGIKKSKVDKWLKELGTEKDLIKRWKEGRMSLEAFRSSYISDLAKSRDAQAAIELVVGLLMHGDVVTLLCGEKDASRCHRSFLKQVLEEKLRT